MTTVADEKEEKRTIIATLAMLVFLGRGFERDVAVAYAINATDKLLAGLDAKK